jgi:hypothetical protein
MPCADCGNPLIVCKEYNDLRCPYCLDLDIESSETIHEKIERDRDRLKDENLVQLIQEYSKDHLLLYLIERLNITATALYENRRIDHSLFSYLNYLIKIILLVDSDEFGDEYLDRDQNSLDEDIELLVQSQAEVVNALNHIEEDFRLCINYPVPPVKDDFVFSEYDLRDTEYHQCYFRNLRSLMGGKEEYVEHFDEASTELRNFDWPGFSEDESLREFAETSYEFILSMLFIASADEIVGETYTTFPPDNVSVHKIDEILEGLDQRFVDDEGNVVLQDSTLAVTTEEELDEVGQEVFPENWGDVKQSLVISKNNLDAHPFLFKLDLEEVVREVSGRPPITREVTRIVYPRFYAKILRFQIFPLLQNGDKPSGNEILNDIAIERGEEFEKNVYRYLSSQRFDSYYSAELPGVESSEIDVIAVDSDEDELWFIECKYLQPVIQMNALEGIQNLNEKFDHKVFNVEADAYEGSPTGLPFPEKVQQWNESDVGDRFTWVDPDGENSISERYPPTWKEYEVRMMVVSNLCPSYSVKEGVEFYTDMEFVQLLHGELDHATPIHEMV